MPTLPLYNAAAPPDGYHRVTAPGGYEWWQFAVAPRGTNAPRLIALTFYDGRPHDQQYAPRYRAYRQRPTRHAPPVPRGYRGAELAVVKHDGPASVTLAGPALEGFRVADDG